MSLPANGVKAPTATQQAYCIAALSKAFPGIVKPDEIQESVCTAVTLAADSAVAIAPKNGGCKPQSIVPRLLKIAALNGLAVLYPDSPVLLNSLMEEVRSLENKLYDGNEYLPAQQAALLGISSSMYELVRYLEGVRYNVGWKDRNRARIVDMVIQADDPRRGHLVRGTWEERSAKSYSLGRGDHSNVMRMGNAAFDGFAISLSRLFLCEDPASTPAN